MPPVPGAGSDIPKSHRPAQRTPFMAFMIGKPLAIDRRKIRIRRNVFIDQVRFYRFPESFPFAEIKREVKQVRGI